MIISNIRNLYPSYENSNIKYYYLTTFFSTAWFIVGVWLFYILEYVTGAQFAVLEAVSFGLAFIIEIPSGAFADLIGRKKSIVLSYSLLFLGTLLLSLTFLTPLFLVIGNILQIVSFAFRSGSFEALIYDDLDSKGHTELFDEVQGKVSSIGLFAVAIGGLAGGLLSGIHSSLPWIFTLVFFGIALFFSTKLEEIEINYTGFDLKEVMKQSTEGLRNLLLPRNQRIVIPLIIILSIGAIWNYGVVSPYMALEFGLDGEQLSYLFSLAFILSSIISYYFSIIQRSLGNNRGILLFGVLSSIGWLIAFNGGGIWNGLACFILLRVSIDLLSVWGSVVLNKLIPKRTRATALSVLSQFQQLGYIFVVLGFGYLISSGTTKYLYIVFAVIIILLCTIFYKNYFKIILEGNYSKE